MSNNDFTALINSVSLCERNNMRVLYNPHTATIWIFVCANIFFIAMNSSRTKCSTIKCSMDFQNAIYLLLYIYYYSGQIWMIPNWYVCCATGRERLSTSENHTYYCTANMMEFLFIWQNRLKMIEWIKFSTGSQKNVFENSSINVLDFLIVPAKRVCRRE